MRVGIIGAGNVARFHLQGYCEAEAAVAAVADTDLESAAVIAAQTGGVAYSDYRDLLSRADVEAVSVCIPNHLHSKVSADALRAGKHVLCEKPMTTTLSDARQLVSVADQSDRCLQVAYMKRYIPAFHAAREALSDIGNLLSATVKVFHHYPEHLWESAGECWGLQKKCAGGGPLVHAGSHILDVLNWWFGPIATVKARIRNRTGLDLDDYTAATMVTDAGLTIFFECGWLPLSHIGYFRDGWDERIEVTGDRGRVELYSTWWDRTEMTPLLRVYREGEAAKEIFTPPVSGFVNEVKGFLSAISDGADVRPDARDGLAVQELIEAMYSSSAQGTVVTIQEL